MPPPVSLAGCDATLVDEQVDELSHLPNRSPTSAASAETLEHALHAHVAISAVEFLLSKIINSFTGDSVLLKTFEEHRDSLRESKTSFVDGYGPDSIRVPEENLTNVQVAA